MCHKAAAPTHNINNTFGPGTADRSTVQWWFKKFCKEDKNFEDEEHSGWPLKVSIDQLRVIVEADPLTATQEIVKELNIDHSKVVVETNPFEANWKGEKTR